MLRKGVLLLIVGIGVSASSAAANKALARAEQLFGDLRYSDAARALDSAMAEMPDRGELIRIREMQGICAGLLNRGGKATAYFEELLSLDADHALQGDWPPRVTTPFFEAKAWIADHGPLTFEGVPPTLAGSQVKALNVATPRDALRLGRRVRFHVKEDAGNWTAKVVDLRDRAASVQTSGKQVQWWAELLSDRGAVLAIVGNATKPIEAAATEALPAPVPPPPPAATPTPPAPIEATSPFVAAAPAPATSDVPVVAKSESEPKYRIPAYVAAAVGAVGLGLGTAFDVQSGNQANTLKNVTVNANGIVTSMTQRQAFALDQSRRTNAAVGNTLLGVGVGLVVVGVVLFVLGSPSSSPEPATGAPQ